MTRQRRRRRYRRRAKMLDKIRMLKQKYGAAEVQVLSWSGYRQGLVVTINCPANDEASQGGTT